MLKHLDVLLKAIAGAVEIVLTVAISFILFGTPITIYSCASMAIVGSGIYVYSTKGDSPSSGSQAASAGASGSSNSVELGQVKRDENELFITKDDIDGRDDGMGQED